MSGYRINEEDIQKALQQLRKKNPGATREYAIQKLESMHNTAKGFAAADPATVKELEKALEEQEDASKDQETQSDDLKLDQPPGQNCPSGMLGSRMIRRTREQVFHDLLGVVIDLAKQATSGFDKHTEADGISVAPGFSRIEWDLPVIIVHLLNHWGNQFKNTELKTLANELTNLIKAARDQQLSTGENPLRQPNNETDQNPAFSPLFGRNIEVLVLIGQDGHVAKMNDNQSDQVAEELAGRLLVVLPEVIESMQATGLIEIEQPAY